MYIILKSDDMNAISNILTDNRFYLMRLFFVVLCLVLDKECGNGYMSRYHES